MAAERKHTAHRGLAVQDRIDAWDAEAEYAARLYLAEPERYPYGQDYARAVPHRLGLLAPEREGGQR
jgi:hypothetical protein